MNTSVSPLPIPIWPLLGLSLALVSVTATVVTFSSQRATQQFRAQARVGSSPEIEASEVALVLRARAQRRHQSGAAHGAT